jgi:hypothetical protein|tara:strand:- start:261 stop:482 length:222 start_codon:yes stop_codon:yes gene_type:complete
MAKRHNDFKLFEYFSTAEPNTKQWQIKSGGSVVTTHRAYEKAVYECLKLNEDPWYYDRGFTLADRVKSYPGTK